MRGSIKLNGRWLPFRARQVIAPGIGFLWQARVAGLIHGYDRWLEGESTMRWKLGGLFDVASASGPDVTRSAAGRGAGEAFWVPTMLLPRFGVGWRDQDSRHSIARIPSATETLEVTYEVGDAGEVQSLTFQR